MIFFLVCSDWHSQIIPSTNIMCELKQFDFIFPGNNLEFDLYSFRPILNSVFMIRD
jgi:hypothetical protein